MNMDERYVSQHDAATICGASYDTIRRRRQRGQFPGARTRPGDPSGTWEIPLSDLVATGLYTPGAEDIDEAIGRGRAERDLDAARVEIVKLQSRLDAIQEVLDRQDTEISYLRKVLADAVRTPRAA